MFPVRVPLYSRHAADGPVSKAKPTHLETVLVAQKFLQAASVVMVELRTYAFGVCLS